MNLPIAIGDWITVEERDYCYGIGELTLEVTEVTGAYYAANDRWITLKGRTIYWNGTFGENRPVAVRESVLREAREKGARRRV